MSDTYTEVKAIIKDLLGADEAKITPESTHISKSFLP